MTHVRYDSLDGLRGAACLAVTVFHFFSAFAPHLISEQSSTPHWISDTPVGILYNGGFAVSVFFVLSGFVVSNAVRNERWPLFLLALGRRYLRLAVPSACSTVFALYLLTLMPDVAPRLQSLLTQAWMTYVITPGLSSFGDAAFEGGVGVFINGSSLFNNVLWTMKIELIGSFAIIAIFTFMSGSARSMLLIAMAAALTLLGRPEYAAFMLGALLREAHQRGRLSGKGALPALIFAIIVGAWTKGFGDRIGLPLPGSVALGEPHKVWHTAAAVAMVYAALIYAPLTSLLTRPVLLFFGRISFGLYLVHVPLIYTVIGLAYLQFAIHGIGLLAALFLAYLSLSILVGYLFTVVVDEPTIRTLRNLQRRMAAFVTTGSLRKAMS